MSHTYRIINYKDGKAVRSRHTNRDVPYNWLKKENSICRRKIYRAYRRTCKLYLKKFGEYIPFVNTNGWETW